jgi:predicted SnoaL-like aldol condensation-catalyzing enzyme
VATQAGKDVLLRMLEMFATGEVDAAPDTVAAGYREHAPGQAPQTLGVAGFCDRVKAERSAYVVLDVWPEGLVADRDQITAQLRWQGVLPTGDTLDRVTIDVVRVRDGRAVEHWTRPVSTRLIPAGRADDADVLD